MATTYKKFKNIAGTGDETGAILKLVDGTNVGTIPFDNANTDYQEYKTWVDAGNTPEAAD